LRKGEEKVICSNSVFSHILRRLKRKLSQKLTEEEDSFSILNPFFLILVWSQRKEGKSYSTLRYINFLRKNPSSSYSTQGVVDVQHDKEIGSLEPHIPFPFFNKKNPATYTVFPIREGISSRSVGPGW
jgi:hypothetical protein